MRNVFVPAPALCLTLVLALLPAPGLAANSGGMEVPDYGGFGTTGYIGSYQPGTGEAAGGNVHIDSGISQRGVYGGYSQGGNATNNSVIISGGVVEWDVNGGSGINAINNHVTISGGTLESNVTGGATNSQTIFGVAAHNTVLITGGTLISYAFGGESRNGVAEYNTIIVTGGTIKPGITGGQVGIGTGARYNTVVISGGTIGGAVNYSAPGTFTSANIIGGHSYTSGDANRNSVIITGGVIGGTLTANPGSGELRSGNIYGGQASNAGDANHNIVIISGGRIGGNVIHKSSEPVYSGNIYGGHSAFGNANYNTVIISGGEIGGRVTSDERVFITSGNIYGGVASNSNTATYNTVTLMGRPNFLGDTSIYGGLSNFGEARLGNTLNVFTRGIRVEKIVNFQHYRFALLGGKGIGLTLTGLYPVDLGGLLEPAPTLAVPYAQPGRKLAVGHTNTLLFSEVGLVNLPDLRPGQARQGAALVYDYTLSQSADGKSILATIRSVAAASEGKSLSEGRAASLAFAGLGADLVAGAGMESAGRAASARNGKGLSGGSDSGYGFVPFAAVQGSSQRYRSGSHVNVNGVAMMAGLARKWEAPAMDILSAAFFEAALGSYRTHNRFSSGSVSGTGDTRTMGGGILARLDITDTALQGLYAEASLRAGSLKNDYTNSDLVDPFTSTAASYDKSSAYYGAHGGLGYIWNLTERASLDMYGKYFWTHQQGQNSTIFGDKFDFKDADSHRTRLGARFAYAVTPSATPYIGAAWEHEFDGKARATTYGMDVPAPSLRGSSAMGEVGLLWQSTAVPGLSADLGVQGFTGQHQGVSGFMQLKLAF